MADTEPLVNGNGAAHESAYVKELQKNIRNVAKKLSAMAKVDSVMAENPDMTLDQLVSARKINNDQKSQALKKPSLQAQLSQLEDQIVQYKKFEEEFNQRSKADKEELTSAHQKELEELRSQIKPQEEAAPAPQGLNLREALLSLSRFLRAAAHRRQLDEDETDETKAFEGALLLLYGGDEKAADTMENIINASDESVVSTEGVQLSVTYKTIKDITMSYMDDDVQVNGEAVIEQQPEIEAPSTEEVLQTNGDASDPTIAHAGLTEQADVQSELTNGDATEAPDHNIEHGHIDAEAANNAAATQWDAPATASSDPISESWVSVPRDPAETENVPNGASANTTQSWADEAMPAPVSVETATAAIPDDGFKEVKSNRGGRGRGGHEGRGDHEGRGGRGRGGRGRGGHEHRGGHEGRGPHEGRGGGGRGRGGFRGGREGQAQPAAS